MIFVTVGDQMPFDRLTQAVDDWAKRRGRTDVFAQIGAAGKEPSFISWTRRLTPTDFQSRLAAADVVVAHAGMGTILSALVLGKRVLVFPRRGDLRETRNDHQLATARRFASNGQVAAAENEADLAIQLDKMTDIKAPERIGTFAAPTLLSALSTFIANTTVEDHFSRKLLFRNRKKDHLGGFLPHQH